MESRQQEKNLQDLSDNDSPNNIINKVFLQYLRYLPSPSATNRM